MMRNLNIYFTKPKKWFSPFSWLIRLVEKTEYSHVAVGWETKLGIEVFYEASGTSLKFLSDKVFTSKNEVIQHYSIPIDKIMYEQLLMYCLENAGVDYGVKQVIGIGWVKFLECAMGMKVRNPYGDGRESQVCSELVGNILYAMKLSDVTIDLESAGPKAIHDLVEKISEIVKVEND